GHWPDHAHPRTAAHPRGKRAISDHQERRVCAADLPRIEQHLDALLAHEPSGVQDQVPVSERVTLAELTDIVRIHAPTEQLGLDRLRSDEYVAVSPAHARDEALDVLAIGDDRV